MAALDDVPVWAVAAAVKRWYRGDCGKDERGNPYDYHWCPDPAALRRIARIELWRVKGRAETLKRLPRAEPLIEFSDEHCSAMRPRFAELLRTIPQVGRDGSGGDVNAS